MAGVPWNQLPNAISVMRMCLVVPVVWLLWREEFRPALALFLIAAVSDGLDGFLAKTFSWQSNIGALLDPMADKLLLSASFATLAITGWVPVWLASLVIMRDLVIIGGACAYHLLIQPLRGDPTKISKLNTAIELAYVVAVLLAAGWAIEVPAVTLTLGAAVLVTVVVSGIDYVWAWSLKARRDKVQT